MSSRLLIRLATFDCRVSKELTTLRRPGRVVEGDLSFFLLSVFSTGRLDHPVLLSPPGLKVEMLEPERLLSAPWISSRLELADVSKGKT